MKQLSYEKSGVLITLFRVVKLPKNINVTGSTIACIDEQIVNAKIILWCNPANVPSTDENPRDRGKRKRIKVIK